MAVLPPLSVVPRRHFRRRDRSRQLGRTEGSPSSAEDVRHGFGLTGVGDRARSRCHLTWSRRRSPTPSAGGDGTRCPTQATTRRDHALAGVGRRLSFRPGVRRSMNVVRDRRRAGPGHVPGRRSIAALSIRRDGSDRTSAGRRQRRPFAVRLTRPGSGHLRQPTECRQGAAPFGCVRSRRAWPARVSGPPPSSRATRDPPRRPGPPRSRLLASRPRLCRRAST